MFQSLHSIRSRAACQRESHSDISHDTQARIKRGASRGAGPWSHSKRGHRPSRNGKLFPSSCSARIPPPGRPAHPRAGLHPRNHSRRRWGRRRASASISRRRGIGTSGGHRHQTSGKPRHRTSRKYRPQAHQSGGRRNRSYRRQLHPRFEESRCQRSSPRSTRSTAMRWNRQGSYYHRWIRKRRGHSSTSRRRRWRRPQWRKNS